MTRELWTAVDGYITDLLVRPDAALAAALDAAAAAGALATTRWGAQPSLPTRSEVEALVQRGRG